MQREQELDAQTLDIFEPGNQQSEVDHDLKATRFRTGIAFGRAWRDAEDGSFSFPLKVDPSALQELSCTYWGGDSGNRTFDIMIDGQGIGSIVGANPRQRLAMGIGLATSATTVQRRILEIPIAEQQVVRVLGVDDWAWCKGRCYGTLLCDLETGRIVDLLSERIAASLAGWLKAHPSVEIISRDRASCYADGSRQGALKAIQVADMASA